MLAVRSKADTAGPSVNERLRQMAGEHLGVVMRYLLSLGVPAADVADAAQETLMVAGRKMAAINGGAERAFLLGTATFVASHLLRSQRRRREVGDGDLGQLRDAGPRPDEVTEHERNLALLDQVIATMPIDLRTVFVLFEIEQLASVDIAIQLNIPVGTVASRLRRARELFHKQSCRIQDRLRREGGDCG